MRLLRPWVAVALLVAATALLRIHLIQAPLERDEGEYAYAGQLMLQGIPPYRLASNMKLPGTYAAYALVMAVFGQTTWGIHMGLLLVNAGAIVLVFLLGRRLFGAWRGVAASAAYALLSVGDGVMGTQAHATHFVVLPALGGVLLLLRHEESGKLRTLGWSGFCFGLAFLAKQHGIFFAVFGAWRLAAAGWREWRGLGRRLLVYGAGFTAPFAVTCVLLWWAGVFERFWFWTFRYASKYAQESSLADGVSSFKETIVPIVKDNPGLWILAAVGMALIWRQRAERGAAAVVTGLLFFSLLAMSPGLYFREHYFVLLLPAVALLAGASLRGRVLAGLFGAALCVSLVQQHAFLFKMTPLEVCRELYGWSPFPEAIPIADYIREHSAPSDVIAVVGSEPEIYFYSHRHSATTYIYTYALMESQPYALTMQNEMIREIETARPKFIVHEPAEEAWLRTADSPGRIFDWWNEYWPKYYRLVGAADTISDSHTEYVWGAALEQYQPSSEWNLEVYERK